MESCLRMIANLDVERQGISTEIVRVVREGDHGLRRDVECLMTVPGVGCLTAVMVRAELGDISPFPTPGCAVSYLGLAPRVRASGKTVRIGPISKEGDAQSRHLLIQAAWSVIRRDGAPGSCSLRL